MFAFLIFIVTLKTDQSLVFVQQIGRELTHVLKYLPLRFLLPPNKIKMDLIFECSAHSMKRYINNSAFL